MLAHYCPALSRQASADSGFVISSPDSQPYLPLYFMFSLSTFPEKDAPLRR